MKLRSALYRTARRLGDVNAVRRGRVPQRLARRAAGRATSRLLRWLFPSVLALALAAGLAACGGSSTGSSASPSTTATTVAPTTTPPTTEAATAGPIILKSGTTTTITTTEEDGKSGRARVTATIKDAGRVVPDRNDDTGGPQYAEHGRFLVATITYVGLAGTYRADGAFWSVRMADGQVYNEGAVIDTGNLRMGQFLPHIRVHQGQRVKGIITFDVPKTHGALVLDTNAEPDVAEWKF